MKHHSSTVTFCHIRSVIDLRCWDRVKIDLNNFNFSIFVVSTLKSVSICFIYPFVKTLSLVSFLIFLFTDLSLVLSRKYWFLYITSLFLFLIRKFDGIISFRKEKFLWITVMRDIFVHLNFLGILLSALGIFHQGKIASSEQRKCYFIFLLSWLDL